MKDHSQLSDAVFAQQFADCSLSPQLFSHEAHLRLAWILIRQYGLATGIHQLCEQIARFDQTFGDGSKFNRTVTVAAAQIMAHFMKKSKSQDFPGLMREFPALKNNFKGLLDSHYGFDIFEHPAAKHNYLEPDLIPFT